MASNREQRLAHIDTFRAVRHTVFDEAYHLKLWYRLNDNPVVQERVDQEEREMEEAYHQDMLKFERDEMFRDRMDALTHHDGSLDGGLVEADSGDVDACLMCGRGYGPHSKENTWFPRYAGAVMPQLCFTCWDI